MAHAGKRMASLAGTRARIVDVVRRSPSTATEIAAELGMTYHAVRPHVLALQRDAVLRVGGQRGTTRPATIYEVGREADAALSQAYVPYAAHLTRVLSERLPRRQVAAIMRDVGRRLAGSLPRSRGTLRERVMAASAILHELGAPNEVENQAATFRIRGFGCLLAEAVHGEPAVCRAMESLLGELLDADVQEHCERGSRPRCCFEIKRAG